MEKQKVLSSATQYHLLPSCQETITLLAIAATNRRHLSDIRAMKINKSDGV